MPLATACPLPSLITHYPPSGLLRSAVRALPPSSALVHLVLVPHIRQRDNETGRQHSETGGTVAVALVTQYYLDSQRTKFQTLMARIVTKVQPSFMFLVSYSISMITL
ncbi:hypothetical protein BC835DRAFT_1338882 [Cytidiella melzeri]|nr:hypothetical protein BC835DRAFT_1338882 [Cytidiella melzeri]